MVTPVEVIHRAVSPPSFHGQVNLNVHSYQTGERQQSVEDKLQPVVINLKRNKKRLKD